MTIALDCSSRATAKKLEEKIKEEKQERKNNKKKTTRPNKTRHTKDNPGVPDQIAYGKMSAMLTPVEV